jgi:hypothetical protein
MLPVLEDGYLPLETDSGFDVRTEATRARRIRVVYI